MASNNGNGPVDLATAAANAAAAERLAGAIVVGLEICEQAGTPLSQVQKVSLIQAALLEFDGLGAQLSSLAVIEELLREGLSSN
jgi:hypothetical protein